jgi:hypothetical protein
MLLLGSALAGFMIAPRHSAYMVVASSPIVALVVAAEARLSGFGLLAGIAITFSCLTVSQMAYLLLMWLSMSHAGVLPYNPSDNHNRQNGQNKIYNEQIQQKNTRRSPLVR